jgi:hypothetical protein
MDLLTYISFAPFPYIFIYFYEHFRIRGYGTVLYIIGWTAFAIGVEAWAVHLEVFTYKYGYRLYFSLPIYLFTQSLTISLFRWMRSSGSGR